MIESLLIANRGEIACRIVRTARRMGVRTVAVCSEVDRNALHARLADEAVVIGPASARESYLNIGAILKAARETGAAAVHPGYGFLSENADFAEACRDDGLVFVGPSARAIRAMGSKSASKEIMRTAGVPLVPGYHGADQGPGVLQRAADEIGYPVLVKASAGGGGRGMRVVERADQFEAAVAAAKREAKGAFGDDTVLIEKYLQRPRHVEVQVFGDSHGNAIHLFERDCSIQRRHQKVFEESPAPGLPEATRRAMGAAAVAAAQAIDYSGAGTVEFLLGQDGSFYFIEMNTRLQVEHPVTELVTGLDLVEWQLRVASGEPLPLRQDDVRQDGHAIEVRLYAEDPGRGFLPQTGNLNRLSMPVEGPHVRVDTGVREGDAISVHYDPMIAKLIVWDHDRPAAVRRLTKALAATVIGGVNTNRQYLLEIAAHPAFAAGEVDTGFIDRHAGDLLPSSQPASDRVLALAACQVLIERRAAVAAAAARSADPWSPWNLTNGWRLNGEAVETVRFRDGDAPVEIAVRHRGAGWRLTLPGGEMDASAEAEADGTLAADLGGRRIRAAVIADGDTVIVMDGGRAHRLLRHDPAAAAAQDTGGGKLTSPMPGKIVRVLAKAGDTVRRGTPLIVLEAMKMEHTIAAPGDGTVERIAFQVGDMVEEGVELVAISAT